MDDYTIREAIQDDKAAIAALLRDHYTPEEVITQGYLKKNEERLTPEVSKYMREEMQEYVMHVPALVAIHKQSQQLAGAILMDLNEDLKQLSSQKVESPPAAVLMHKLITAVYTVGEKTGVYQTFTDLGKVVKVRCLSVSREHRSKGLGAALMQACVDWVDRHGYEHAFSFFMVPNSIRAGEKAGFKTLGSCDLHEIRDDKGERYFADVSPNNIAKFMAWSK